MGLGRKLCSEMISCLYLMYKIVTHGNNCNIYLKIMKSTGFDYNNLDRQIADMFKCKPLPELEVKALCEKVPPHTIHRLNKSLPKNLMLSQCGRLSSCVAISMGNSMI